MQPSYVERLDLYSNLSLGSILIVVLEVYFVSCLLKKETVWFSASHHYLHHSYFSVHYMRWRYRNPQLAWPLLSRGSGQEWQSGLPKRPPPHLNLLFRSAAAHSDSVSLPSRSAAFTGRCPPVCASVRPEGSTGCFSLQATFSLPRPHLVVPCPSQDRFLW